MTDNPESIADILGASVASTANAGSGYSAEALAQAQSSLSASNAALYEAMLDSSDGEDTRDQVTQFLCDVGIQVPYEIFLQFCIDEENQ